MSKDVYSRRDFVKSIGIGASLMAVPTFAWPFGPKKQRLPNIVLILADDLGYGGLGCYGATLIKTPNCDRLAQEGIRFTDAHSPAAVCTPTRYGVLTGRYAWRTWLKNWILMEHMPLLIDTDQLTLPSMLKKQGYRTACVGKWHLGWGSEINPDWDKPLSPGPLETGFDYFFGPPYSHNSSPKLQVFVENNRIYGLQQGETLEDQQVLNRVTRRLEDTATELSKRAVRFVEQNKDQPFFLYYPITNIHSPHTPNERFVGKSQDGKYGDFVTEFDWAVGEVTSALDRLKLTDNTLIIVTSDNGAYANWSTEKRANGLLRGGKGQIYEGGHRIPFIARWSGKIKPGTASHETICLTDFMATFASITGFKLPQNAAQDSCNILPALLNKPSAKPLREATIHHSTSGMFAIRKGKWKLIDGLGDGRHPADMKKVKQSGLGKPVRNLETKQFEDLRYSWPAPPVPKPGQPRGQLYDLEADPQESLNLWNKHPEVVTELLTLLNTQVE